MAPWMKQDLEKRTSAIKKRAEEDAALEADMKVAITEGAAEQRRQHQAVTFEAALAAATAETGQPLDAQPPKPALNQERRGKKTVTII